MMINSFINNIIQGFALSLEKSRTDLLHAARDYLPAAKGLSDQTGNTEYDKLAEKYEKIVIDIDNLVIGDLDLDNPNMSKFSRNGEELKKLARNLHAAIRDIANKLEEHYYIYLVVAGSAYNASGETVTNHPAHSSAMALDRVGTILRDVDKQLEDLEHIMFMVINELVDLVWR